jgi:hypothetical protein
MLGFSSPWVEFSKLHVEWNLHLHPKKLLWELRELYENLQNPTQIFSYNGMNNQALHLVSIDFSSAENSSAISFFSGCSSSFVDRRMGCCEWMLWMWYAHDHTPSIHNASMTWIIKQQSIESVIECYAHFSNICDVLYSWLEDDVVMVRFQSIFHSWLKDLREMCLILAYK